MKKTARTIFTFGHSNKPFWYFRLKLLQNEIDLVVDVRSIPQSRYCPHFSKNALQRGLWEKHIKYQWLGKNLGGRGINTNYDKTVDEVTALVKKVSASACFALKRLPLSATATQCLNPRSGNAVWR